jgi:HAD superfamily hydrolase (TIGR01549 family)
VNFGYVSEADAMEALLRLAAALGGLQDWAIKMETSMEKSHPRRKPNPGMLMELMELYGVSPHETLMVGDRPEDAEAAKAAGCEFIHRDVFFGGMER